MAHKLTVYRVGTKWAYRDVTGTSYAQSSDIEVVIASAEEVARRQSAQVVLTPEAEEHRRACSEAISVDVQPSVTPTPRRRFRNFMSRFARKKRGI